MDTSRDGLRMLDKIVIVTGGIQGIGRGCVDVFVSQGATVVVLDIQDDIGKTLKADKGKGEIFYIHCDMTKEEDIKKAVDIVIEKYGRLDCLINNVGTFMGPSNLDNASIQEFRNLLDLNVVSYMATSKYCLPHLRKTKGNIVNITSVCASRTQKSSVCYCATKGAGVSFTKSLALDEAKNGVRVNCVSPGAITTPLQQKVVSPELLESFKMVAAQGRYGLPEEIGRACLFMATDGTYCTGAELLCTGGADIGVGLKNTEDNPYI